MLNKLKKKARKATALVRGSSTSYTPSSGRKAKDLGSPVDATQPSAFAYTPVHLEFLDFSPGGAKYPSSDRKRHGLSSPPQLQQKSATLPRESFLMKPEEVHDDVSVASNKSDTNEDNIAQEDKRHSTFSTFRGSGVLRYTDDNASRTDDRDLDIIDNYHQSYIEGEGSPLFVVGHHILEAPPQFSSETASPDSGSPVPQPPHPFNHNSVEIVKISQNPGKRTTKSKDGTGVYQASKHALPEATDSTDPEDTSPESSISSPKRTKPESPSKKSPVPPPPQRSSSVDILREMSIDVGHNALTTQSDGEEVFMPGVINGNSVSADTYSLGSSVYSDTVYFTPDEQGHLSSKHNLKRNQIPRANFQIDQISNRELTELSAQSLSTFKSPFSPGNNHSETKLKKSERSNTFGAVGSTRPTISLKKKEREQSSTVNKGTHDSGFSRDKLNHETTDKSKNRNRQFVNNRDKSWQDTAAVEDYSMEMLRREDYQSVNPNTIEYSIVDDKTVNDTNNNLDSDLFDGVERDKVEIEDWFDTSNLADHTSMIVQAMMSDVFDPPSNPIQKYQDRNENTEYHKTKSLNEETEDEYDGNDVSDGYEEHRETKRKFLDPDVHSRYGSTDTLTESVASSVCTSVSQLEKSQENQVMTKSMDNTALVNEIEYDAPRYAPGKNTPVYKRKFDPGQNLSVNDKHNEKDDDDNDLLYNDSVMENLVKPSNRYVNRLKGNQGQPRVILSHSVNNTMSSLQYSLRDMERLDRREDWKYNCSYSEAMEQENIELQSEEKRKSAAMKDDQKRTSETHGSTIQLEYANVENKKGTKVREERKGKNKNNVSKPPRSEKPARSLVTEQQARIRRQRSYMTAVGRDQSYLQDMQDVHEDSCLGQNTTAMEFRDPEESNGEKCTTVAEKIERLETLGGIKSSRQRSQTEDENANGQNFLNPESRDRLARWSLNVSYQKAVGADDSNSTQEDQCFAETETLGRTSDLGGSMTSDEDKITLQSETDSYSARITSEENRINFEEDDPVSDLQENEHEPTTTNEYAQQLPMNEKSANKNSYCSDLSGDSKINVSVDNGVCLANSKEANHASLSETSENNRPTDTNMFIEERDDLVSTVNIGRGGEKEDTLPASALESLKDKGAKYEENTAQGTRKSREDPENQVEPYMVEFTTKANASIVSNEDECRKKFKRFISDLHLEDTSPISEASTDDVPSDSPRRKKPVPSPRKSKIKHNNKSPELKEHMHENNDRKREAEKRKGNDRELSPYDNVPVHSKNQQEDDPRKDKEIVKTTNTTASLPKKHTKVNPILAQYLRKFTTVPISPGNSSLPGPQENNSSVMVEDDYVPDSSLQASLTSSFLPQQDGSVMSHNIILEGSLSFLKNTGQSENTLIGGDVILDNNTTRGEEDTNASINNSTNKVFSSPTKYSFLDMNLSGDNEESELSSEEEHEQNDNYEVPKWSTKAIDEWTTEDVIDWCKYNGFLSVLSRFEDAESMKKMLIQDKLTEEDLVETDVTDEMVRKRFVGEVSRLKKSQEERKSPLYRLKQVSVKRKTLEVSSDLIKDRLYNLQKLSDIQQRRIHNSLTEIQHQQLDTNQLLRSPYDRRLSASADNLDVIGSHRNSFRKRNVYSSGLGIDAYEFSKIPLAKWSNVDVLDWLIYSGLHQHAHTFAVHNITGQDLADINLSLLDKLGLRSTEEREQILSKLYEIQHPSGPTVAEILKEPFPKSKISHPKSPRESRSLSGREGHNERSKHDIIQRLHVWHDLSGQMDMMVLNIGSNTPSIEIVQDLLSSHKITDDINLFYLAITKPNKDSKELADKDFPAEYIHGKSGVRLELRHRIGTTVKVIQKLHGQKPQGKVFRMAAVSTCKDILHVAFRKFLMNPTDMKNYVLLEINKKTGDTYYVDEKTSITALNSDSFILCEIQQTSQAKISESESQDQEPPSEFLPSKLLRLESFEARVVLEKMAEIEASISGNNDASSPDSSLDKVFNVPPLGGMNKRHVTPRKQRLPSSDRLSTSSLVAEDQLELLREIALLRETVREKETEILQLQREVSSEMKSRTPEVNVEHKAIQYDGPLSNEEIELMKIEQNLQKFGQGVALQEDKFRTLKRQLEHAKIINSEDADIYEKEVHEAEKRLIKMKQHQADLFAKVELKRKDIDKHQQQEKDRHNKQSEQAGASLYDCLHKSPPQCIVCVKLHSSDTGYGFLQGRDKNNRPIVKYVEEGRPLQKGDRLLEVNAQRLYDKEDVDLQQTLRTGAESLRVVILRDLSEQHNRKRSSTEIDSLKDDLKLTVMELETVQEENADLLYKLKRTEKLLASHENELEEMKSENDKLKTQLVESEEKWKELKDAVADMRLEKTTNNERNYDELKKRLTFGDVNLSSFETEDNTSASDRTKGSENQPNKVIAYDQLDQHAPLWETLKSAPKEDILQVLKDHLMETQQQKRYFDHLLNLVIEEAPELLIKVDSYIGITDSETLNLKPHSEEFC